MPKKIDLAGRVFGRLAVIEEAGRKNRSVAWLCRCECGEEVAVKAGNLASGATRSCGCLRRERASEAHLVDLTSKVFGRLTVLRENGRDKHGQVLWLCRCECGEEVAVKAGSLASGATRSCGCLNRERASEAHLVDLTGKVFGRLTVLRENGRDKHGQVLWLCRCECGEEVAVKAGNLASGQTRSCGCDRESRGEEAVAAFLNEEGIPHRREARIIPGRAYRFDFLLTGRKALVEFHGIQHYKPSRFHKSQDPIANFKSIQKRDKFKRAWAYRNGFRFVTVRFDCRDIAALLRRRLAA